MPHSGSAEPEGASALPSESGAGAITVAICAYTMERWNDIVGAVESARAQEPPPAEVVLVIDYNDELLARANKQWPRATTNNGASVRVFPNRQQRGLSGARNTAIEHASGEILVFLDDDAAGEEGWLARLVAPYADDGVVVTGGAAEPVWRAAKPTWWPAEFHWVIGCSWIGLPKTKSDVRNVIGCNMSARRAALVEVGGFADGIGRVGTRALGCEETDLCIRLTAGRPERRVVYVPDAVVHHAVPASRLQARYFFDRCYSEGLSKALVVGRVGGASGLASERAYTVRVLPRGAWRGVSEALRGDLGGLGRAGAISAGLLVVTVGFAVGRLRALVVGHRPVGSR